MAVNKVFVRSPYNYDTNAASDESGVRCEDPSLAIQSQKDDADINVIVKRFGLTGQMPTNIRLPEYADYEAVFDFQTAMQVMKDAEASFMSMPGEVRARFANDPQYFLEFCNDPKNADEMLKLGLRVAKVGDSIPAASVIPPAETGEKS